MNGRREPIRVVQIIARLNIGGPAIVVALMTHHFSPPRRPDYESTLVVGQIGAGEGDMRDYADSLGVMPIDVPALGRELHPLRDLRTLWTLYRLLRRLRPHIVHTHTAKAGVVGRIAARLAGVPVVVHTFHGHVFSGYFSPARTRVFLMIERFAARLTDRVIALTESQAREIAVEYGVVRPEQMRVIPLGLDLTPFTSAARGAGVFRHAYGIPLEVPLIGIVGRIVPIKNHLLFLEAAARLLQQVPDAYFVIVGDGEPTLRGALAAHSEYLQITGRIIFTGWIRDLAPVYADLNALAISSLNEGTPVSVIEALAACVPVASTHVGGVPELLEGGALGALAPLTGDTVRDADALAQAIQSALMQPAARTMQIAHIITARYSVDRMIGDLDALYQSLLTEKVAGFK